jgi:hypothetical protein
MLRSESKKRAAFITGLLVLAGASGCASDAQTGALVGTGFGAIMGQAIGGNTTGTLIGAGVGAGAGYMIGNEGDRRAAREEQARRDRELDRRNREHAEAIRRLEAQQAEGAATASAQENAPTTGTFIPPAWPDATSQMQPFADTIWRVTSMTPPPRRQFASMTLHFLPNGQVVTSTSFPDGTNRVGSETYRVVGNTLIINGSEYLTNSVWIMNGNELTLINQGFRTVLERAGDGD